MRCAHERTRRRLHRPSGGDKMPYPRRRLNRPEQAIAALEAARYAAVSAKRNERRFLIRRPVRRQAPDAAGGHDNAQVGNHVPGGARSRIADRSAFD